MAIDNAFDFAMYGTVAAMAGEFANSANAALSTTHVRRSAKSLALNTLTELRYVYRGGVAKGKGVSYAVYMEQLPSDSDSNTLVEFRDSNNVGNVIVVLMADGRVKLCRSDGQGPDNDLAVLATSDRAYFSAGTFNSVEAYAYIDGASGAAEVRINGVTAINFAGSTLGHRYPHIIDPPYPDAETAQIAIGAAGEALLGYKTMWITDLVPWDTTGSYNNDFIGDKYAAAYLPDGDTPQADMTPSTGTAGYAMLDNVPPLDDTEHLIADSIGDASQFTLEDSDPETVAIAGVVLKARAWKTAAGTNKLQLSGVSGVDEFAGDEHALTTTPTYYADVMEVDPATSAPFTPSGFDSLELLLTRTA